MAKTMKVNTNRPKVRVIIPPDATDFQREMLTTHAQKIGADVLEVAKNSKIAKTLDARKKPKKKSS